MQAAIVGAGGAGLLHALAFRAHGVAVRDVFDPDLDRARNLASLLGARATGSFDVIADCDAECVSICSPPRWHAEQAARCAREGRTVFVEKPVAVSLAELERLETLPGCVPVVQWRAGRGIRAVRDAVAAFLLGPSPSACIDVLVRRSADYFAAGRGTSAGWGAGALLSVGIHALDAACFALGRAALRVEGAVCPSGRGEVERTACAIVALSGGACATVRVTFDAACDEVRLAFAGGGVTAIIEGGEVDPTSGRVRWQAAARAKRARFEAFERTCGGHDTPPLLVPYIGDALRRLRSGTKPGEQLDLPSIADVAQAHAIALRATAVDQAGSACAPCARRSARTACSCACCIR